MHGRNRSFTIGSALRLATSIGTGVLLLAACSNPMLVQMTEQITNDVQIALAGDAPAVTDVNPADGATDVSPAVQVEVTFSLSLDPESTVSESVYLMESETEASVSASVTYDDETRTVTVVPEAVLDKSVDYTLVVTTDVTSVDGAQLAQQFQSAFTTRAVRDDEILIDLSYGGPYEFSRSHPMWITVIPHPYETGDESTPGDEVYEVKATAQGLVSIAEADLPSEYAEDGTYFVLLTHDLSNDYAGFGEGASLSTNGFLDTSHEDGLSIDGTDADGNDLITSHSSSITVQESAQVSLGSLYPVRYTDTPLVEPDTDEPNDDRASAGSVTSIGTAYPRTLGWDDVDWFEFVPTVTDEYRVVVADNPYNPDDEDELDLEFPVRLSVYVYDSGSGGIAHMGSDYDDDSTSADDYGLVDTWLQAGEQYYFEVSSPAKTDVGDYVLKVIPAEIAYDVDEPSNDDHVPGGGTEVPFGYDNYLDRTAHKHDTDYFWLDTAGLMESNLTFAIETEPGPGETQTLDLTPSVLIYDEDAMELYHVGSNYDGGFADNYRNNLQPDQRYELRIRNNSSSSIDYYQPTGAYRLRFLYGPDYWDYDTTNDRPYAYGETDDVISYSSMDTLYDGSTSYHTIYRTDDVDFIEINTGSNTSVTITLSVAEAYSDGIWSNDFYADFDVYNPAAAEYATSLTSNGSGSFTLDSGDGLDGSNQTWYIRVFRASNSPIPTGAYKITVTGS